jgi:hypothetical protein
MDAVHRQNSTRSPELAARYASRVIRFADGRITGAHGQHRPEGARP